MLEHETQRCSGHCCEVFFLPVKPDKIDELRKTTQDGEAIASMVVPLGEAIKDLPKRLRRMLPQAYHEDPDKILPRGYFYTCKHLDPKTKNCGIYVDRPAMCREMPYGSHCPYVGCTRKTTPLAIGATGTPLDGVTISSAGVFGKHGGCRC